uniref:ATPase ASNA1 homolog n=1 Tax=Chromera velia CCMP2878 TaxID=1169474 RepID=A0A0G4GJH0_9ALVE|mmetsp:Transcript_42659/g.84147  ORF Transcript_42659/g.84147 Transcript_42659/m.84147 type:complete len:358 (+) Transcript_42659:141-1214(+)|eukprot:Cvel_4785.t1-p1 / transcript=Cvel_4785.t1 / gene=Cvel_4785 / organism=Chromera_velia_CCMP2878 / gene_product=ATPase ASNA1 homolog, putative / transcript_product=ATPase ASNA1 homolog, putative / location=Cvel_scaffold214:3271-5889(-) / protein_length=357 / sequence_SO=supercontig / SO=protein_coding / is_pseudo=false
MEDEEDLEFSLGELFSSPSLKWVFVGGKGGVGKTTTSCSIAVEFARRKEKVLILSTDPAHNLSDAFEQKFTNEPTKVHGFENLFAMEVEASFQESTGYRLEGRDGISKVLPELVSAIPGIDEAMSFAELMQSVQTMDYSIIIFDTAPTGHTLRLLSFPTLLEKAFSKLQDLRDKLSGAVQMANAMGASLDADDLSTKLDGLRAVTTTVRTAFQDPTRTTFVCVCIPEFLSVYETERLIQDLAKNSIDCSNIVVNQVIFPVEDGCAEATDDLCKVPEGLSEEQAKQFRALATRAKAFEAAHLCRRKMQSKYLVQVRDLYAMDFHVVSVPLQPEEVRGVAKLRRFAQLLQEPRDLPILE